MEEFAAEGVTMSASTAKKSSPQPRLLLFALLCVVQLVVSLYALSEFIFSMFLSERCVGQSAGCHLSGPELVTPIFFGGLAVGLVTLVAITLIRAAKGRTFWWAPLVGSLVVAVCTVISLVINAYDAGLLGAATGT